jgi:hypothetical protein
MGGFSIPKLVNWVIGKPLLFVGVILVLLGRGCDAVSLRGVARTKAIYTSVQQDFANKWDNKFVALNRDIRKEQKKMTEKDADVKKIQENLKELQEKSQKLRDERQEEQDKLEDSTWKSYRESSQAALNQHSMYVWWFEWTFIAGTIILMIGLLTIAFTAIGPERWVAYIMIAIITLSVYVFGAAWLESIFTSSMSISNQPTPIIKGGGPGGPFDK